MNILIAVSDLQTGGAQRLVIAIANQLAQRHQVHLYNYNLFSRQQLSLSPQLADQVHRHSLPWWLTIFPDKLYWLLALAGLPRRFFRWANALRYWHIYRIVRRDRIDIISSHLFDADYLVATGIRGQTTPVVVTDHGDYQYLGERRPAQQQAIQAVLSRATAVVYIADCNVHALKQTAAVHKLCKIHNGIAAKTSNFDLRKQLHLPGDAFVFGMVARGIPEKGWAAAIQAFERVCQAGRFSAGEATPSHFHREVHLVLVGDSVYLKQLQKHLPQPLARFVHFAGHTHRPLDWIQGFDVGLLPSYFAGESLPMVIAEYLSKHKPVIASDIGGIAEMLSETDIRNAETAAAGSERLALAGTLLSPAASGRIEPEAIAKAMKRYLQDPQLLQNQAENAARLFRTKFNIKTCAAAYETLFQSLNNHESNAAEHL